MANMSPSTPPPSQATATSQHSTIQKRPVENANGDDHRAKRQDLGKNRTERPLSTNPAYLLYTLICAAHDYAYPALKSRIPHMSREAQAALEPCPREGSIHLLTPETRTEVEEEVVEVLSAAGHLQHVLESGLLRMNNNRLQLEEMAHGRSPTLAVLMEQLLELSPTLKRAMSLDTRPTGSCGVLAASDQRHVVRHESDDNLITLPMTSVSTNYAYQQVDGPQNNQVQRIADETTSHADAPTPMVAGWLTDVLHSTTDTQTAQRIVDGVGPSRDGQGQLDSESAGHAEASRGLEGEDVEMYDEDDAAEVDEETAVEEDIVAEMCQGKARTAASAPTVASAPRAQRPRGVKKAKTQAVISREASGEPEVSQNSGVSSLSEEQTIQTNPGAPKPRKTPSTNSTQRAEEQKKKLASAALWAQHVDQKLPQPLFTLRLSLTAYDSIEAQQPHARAVLVQMFEHEFTENTLSTTDFDKKCPQRVTDYLKVLKHLASAFSKDGLQRLQSARVEFQYRCRKDREKAAVREVAEVCSNQYVRGCIEAMAFLSRGKPKRELETKLCSQTVLMYIRLHNDFESTLQHLLDVGLEAARTRILQWASEHGFAPDDKRLDIAKYGKVGIKRVDTLHALYMAIFNQNRAVKITNHEFKGMRQRALWVTKVVRLYTPSIFVMVKEWEKFISAGARELRKEATMDLFLGYVAAELGELSELARMADRLLVEPHVFKKVELSSLDDLSSLTDDTLATLDENEGAGGDARGMETYSEVTETESERLDADEEGDQDGLSSTDAPEDELSDARSDGSSSHAQLSSIGSERPTRNVSPGEATHGNEATDAYGDQASIDDVASSHTCNSGRSTVATGSLSDELLKAAAKTSESIVVPGVTENAAPGGEPMDMDLDESSNVARSVALSMPVAAPTAHAAVSSHNSSSITPEDSTWTGQPQLVRDHSSIDLPTHQYEGELGRHFDDQMWYVDLEP